MSKLKLRIPNYDKAEADFFDEIIQGFVALDPLLGKIPTKRISHDGPTRNVRNPKILDQPLVPIEAIMNVSFDTIRDTNIEQFIQALYGLANSMHEAQAKLIFQHIADITDAAGNTTDAQGQPFSYDMLNGVLEKMDIYFNEQGAPILPTLYVSPITAEKIKEIKPTSEQEQRLQEIIAQKRVEYNAKKRTRRLS